MGFRWCVGRVLVRKSPGRISYALDCLPTTGVSWGAKLNYVVSQPTQVQ